MDGILRPLRAEEGKRSAAIALPAVGRDRWARRHAYDLVNAYGRLVRERQNLVRLTESSRAQIRSAVLQFRAARGCGQMNRVAPPGAGRPDDGLSAEARRAKAEGRGRTLRAAKGGGFINADESAHLIGDAGSV